jgi:fermentation-respiration switch protein FrsA (DUF1100 family)
MKKRLELRMGFLAVAVAVYVGLVLLLFFAQRHLLYHPDQTVPVPAEYGVGEMQTVPVATADGLRLHAWWRPPRTAESPVIAYFHGNSGHIGGRAAKVRPYLDAGYGVLLLSYRYNAGVGGSPSEENLFADGRAALAFLQAAGIPDDRIVLYGESLGSGVAVAMAAEHRIGALVLEAPYNNMAKLAQHHYWYSPARWLVRDRFDSESRIAGVGVPLLVVHGDQDAVIPPKFAQQLFAAAKEPKEFRMISEARHNNLLDYGLTDIVGEFLGRVFPKKSG